MFQPVCQIFIQTLHLFFFCYYNLEISIHSVISLNFLIDISTIYFIFWILPSKFASIFFKDFQSHFSMNLKFEWSCGFNFQSILQFLILTFHPIFFCHYNLEIWINCAMSFNPLIDIPTIYLDIWIMRCKISIDLLQLRNYSLHHLQQKKGWWGSA